jgi:hypothetical protein
MASPLVEFIPLGLLVEFVLNVMHPLVVAGGAGAASFRTWAVLAGKPEDTLRRWTATGTVAGAGFMLLIVLVDLALEGG